MTAISNRYDFVFFFDVENGNPNGDPDAGNMPRIDPETNYGLVTDVCLKRKVRNYVGLAKGDEFPFEIYVKEKAVLNNTNKRAYEDAGIKPDKKLPKDHQKAKELTAFMCRNFYDIRSFGAVMTTAVNCGQVRGPVQFSFAKSIDPIITQEISITRMAVTNESDAANERTMGRKHIVPYALYRAEGFISAPLAEQTGFSDDDLALLFEALGNMFEHDRSAARGKMAARKLVVFKHGHRMGNAQAQDLFDRVLVTRANDAAPARQFADYKITVDTANLPDGVSCEEKI